MTNNYISPSAAVELADKMTRLRYSKPFKHCVQCRCSRFVMNAHNERVFICKKPNRRSVVINPGDPIAGCPYAERHTNTDVLSRDVCLILSRLEAEGKGQE